ncbi:TetR/AcrR family transcriptional regulator [Micromonospora sp. NPDC048909]|uniref:TetR/AcrR family transcriptional regulator n=1 Tax=Micromonospora sp. NPDC048909 TaxID=3155643 RepID=UPI0033C2E68C
MTRQPDPRRRNEQSRRAILQAAAELCVQVGFAATTVEGIAARAGVGKQTIYRWWPSKAAVLLEYMQDLRAATADFLDTGDVLTDLVAQTTAVQRLLTSDAGAIWRGLLVTAQTDDAAASGVRELIERAIDDGRARLATAQRDGQIRADVDLDIAVELIFGPLYHAWLLRARTLPEQHMAEVLRTLFAGLAPTPA